MRRKSSDETAPTPRHIATAVGVWALLASAAYAQDATSVVERPKGGQDIFGHYEVVADWPKPLAQLPGHAGWTYGAAQSVFAESADRIYVLERGELPLLERPATQRLRDVGPSLAFPVFRLPFRDATVASPPAGGAAGQMPADGLKAWQDEGGSRVVLHFSSGRLARHALERPAQADAGEGPSAP